MERNVSVQIPKNYYISWFVTTQTSCNVTVTLKDDQKTYFSNSKNTTNISPPLAMSAGFVSGDNLTLIIKIDNVEHILGTPHLNDILTDEGISVGKEFTMCIEDWKDKDYNDVAVSIIGWKKAG